ncbi:MAG: TetR/AcrR family transcriptional regulator [Syntrophomonadaceae bacterium]|nr:TetR/AcrR family transcriptional regulator [Syntrophomonadaceae bacterium]
MSRTVKSPDERRQELLGIGLELFMKHGSVGFSIKDVVKQAGVATGLFYYYFKSKEEYIEEALNSYIIGNIGGILEVISAESFSIAQRVRCGLVEFWKHMEHMAPFMREDALQSPQHHILMDKALKRLQPAMQDLIEQGNRAGLFHAFSPALTASFVLHGLSGVLHSSMELNEENKKSTEKMLLSVLGADMPLQGDE